MILPRAETRWTSWLHLLLVHSRSTLALLPQPRAVRECQRGSPIPFDDLVNDS